MTRLATIADMTAAAARCRARGVSDSLYERTWEAAMIAELTAAGLVVPAPTYQVKR